MNKRLYPALAALLVLVGGLALWPICVSASPRAPQTTSDPVPTPFAVVTAVSGEQPALKAATTAGVSFTGDPYRTYTLVHSGVDSAGATATGLVCIGINAAPSSVDWVEGANKFPLTSGSAIVVGPFAGTVHLKSATGSPMIAILPSGQTKP